MDVETGSAAVRCACSEGAVLGSEEQRRVRGGNIKVWLVYCWDFLWMFSGCSWPQVTESKERTTEDEGVTSVLHGEHLLVHLEWFVQASQMNLQGKATLILWNVEYLVTCWVRGAFNCFIVCFLLLFVEAGRRLLFFPPLFLLRNGLQFWKTE